MIIKRDYYVQQLISSKSNNLIKIVTGIRRERQIVSSLQLVSQSFDRNRNKRRPYNRNCIRIDDSFKKIIIMRDDIKPNHDNNGFYIVGLMDFLLKPDLMEQL